MRQVSAANGPTQVIEGTSKLYHEATLTPKQIDIAVQRLMSLCTPKLIHPLALTSNDLKSFAAP
jgi:hypothetical protein